MLTSLKVDKFKCFDTVRLGLRPLTLFTGYNGAGKSSFVQPLFLLSQALRHNLAATGLALNGPMVRLGTAGDVASSGSPRFEICAEDETIAWNLSARSGDRLLAVSNASADYLINGEQAHSDWKERLWPSDEGLKARLDHLSTTASLESLVALSATRAGTLDVQPIPDSVSPVFGDVGIEGQFASFWYDRLVDEEVAQGRRLQEEPATTVRKQVDAYLARLFEGAQANVTAIAQASAYAIRFRLKGDGDWRRPANIGYGLSYAFPIVVALLSAKPGQTLVIDSPEAHLHPSAQSKMGGLIALVAASGVQVFVETHSDHLLNGVRLAVRDSELSKDDVAIHFFSGARSDGHGVTSPQMGDDGRISDWPSGFFDQSEADLARLAGWG